MASNWIETTLGGIADPCGGVVDGPFGSNLPASGYVTEGIPVIRGSNLSLGKEKFKQHEFVYISQDAFEKLQRSECLPNDIIFTKKGTLGQTGIIPNPSIFTRYILSSNQMRLRVDPLKALPAYIYYVVSSPQTIEKIIRDSDCTGVPKINLEYLRKFPVKLPDLKTQKAIAHILGSLDDKIELNRQMNETLEAMAQALFKSWFVDFDPVIDNALAAGNAIPDEFVERAEQRKGIEKKDHSDTQNLFPDEFEFSEEMGWIPKGWVITNLKDHAEKISKGTTPSKAILAKADDDSTIPFLKVRDLDDEGKIDTQNLDLIPKSIHENALKRSILQTGDLLFSIAGTIGRVSIVPKELDNSNSNQALAFIRPKDDIKTYFLLQFLKSQEVQDEISSRVVQAVQANVSLTELGSLKFATASDDLFRKWHSIVQSWIDKINLLQMENSHLSKLRDTLLPKLMSGELRIADAAALVDKTI